MATWTSNPLFPIACCLLLLASPTPGQASRPAAATRGQASQAGPRPGGMYRGRSIGFVPIHERVHEAEIPPSGRVKAGSPANDLVVEGPAQASYHESVEQLIGGEPDLGYGVTCDGGWAPDSGVFMSESVAAVPLVWGRADYLLWWTRGMSAPSLATTSTEGTPQERAGILGDPDTSVLFGATGLNDESRSGGRMTIGRWFDPTFAHGFDITYLWLAEGSDDFMDSGEDRLILARPFLNLQADAEDSRLIVFPDVVDGTLTIRTATDFQSWEAVFRHSVARWADVQTDYSFGYRYAALEDYVRIDEATVSLGGPTVDSTFDLFDQVGSRNRFHGGQLGIRILRHTDAIWSIELNGKVALGATTSTLVLEGETVATSADGQSNTTDSGLLVQSTNRGTYEDDTFSTLSEIGVTLRRQFGCGLAARFGYSFLYWSDVLRAGEQFDLSINTSQIPPGTLEGEPRPAVPLDTAGFWAQGMHFGLDYRY